MSGRTSLFRRYELFIVAATLASHATAVDQNHSKGGEFRQREVKFLLELFSNWMDVTINASVLDVQHTQIQRYLNGLVAEGLAKKRTRKSLPTYSLTRAGILELLRRMTIPHSLPHPGHLFFILFFLSSYRPILLQLATIGSTPFPPTLRTELEGMLDCKALSQKFIEVSKTKLAALQIRIADTQASSMMTDEMLSEGSPPSAIFKKIEETYPYELNSQKPLNELLSSLPEDRAIWELTSGATKRNAIIWKPMQQLMQTYVNLLEKFSLEQAV